MATAVKDAADFMRDNVAQDKKQKELWDEGGAARAALHAIAGGLLGGVNGVDAAIKSAIAAGVSTLIAPYINDIVKEAVAQSGLTGEDAKRMSDTLTSSIVLGLLAGAGGSDAAAYASNEIKYNLLTFDESKRIIQLEKLMKQCALNENCTDDLFATYQSELNELLDKNEKTNLEFIKKCQEFGKERCDNIVRNEYYWKYQQEMAIAIKNGDPDSEELNKWLRQNYNVMQFAYDSTPSILHDFVLSMGQGSQLVNDIFLAGVTGGESIVWRKVFSRNNSSIAASSVISKELLKAELAAKEIINAPRVGSALKTDTYHSAAGSRFIINQIPEKGRVFTRYGNDGKPYTLTQMEGAVNGKPGVFEWIVNYKGQLTHNTFVPNATITGKPNGGLPIN